MAAPTTSRKLGSLQMRAAFVPSTLDAEARTVELTWSTGAAVLRGSFDPYYEELSMDPAHVRMDRLNSGAPVLDTHDTSGLRSVIGVVEIATVDGKIGRARVRFDSGPEGTETFRKISEGIVRNSSVGYHTYRMQLVEQGEAEIPTYRAIDWEPHEISMVPIGADAGAGVRSGDDTLTTCVFEERSMALPTPKTPSPAAVTTPPATTTTTADEVRAAAEGERARIVAIQRAGTTLGRPSEEIAAAIETGTSADAFRAAAIDAHAAAATIRLEPRIEAGEDSRAKFLRGAENWVLERSGRVALVREHARARGETVDLDPGEFRGLRMIDLARQCLERSGVRTSGKMPVQLVGEAFTHRSAGAASTGDFSVLLENALHKILLAQYAVTPDTWSRFCATGSVGDFKASKRYRLGSFGVLSQLNELGEFTNKAIPDGERQSLTIGTKGNIIGISRQAIIDDDLQAFSSLATMLGRAAKLTIESDVYALLALNAGLGPTMNDGLTLFHATHANITTGAALGSAAIDADRVAMGLQRDPSGNEILDLTPTLLLLSKGLGGTARQINNGAYDFDSTKFQTANRVGGLFSDIIDTGRITGTRRYLFADPGVAPTIEVAFLDGQKEPFMDMQQGWRVDGAEWKVRLDYGVAGIDWRGAITNAGA